MPVPGTRLFVVLDPATSAAGGWSNGHGQRMREYSILSPSASLLGSISLLTSPCLPFPACLVGTVGHSLWLCACTGVLLALPSHCSAPLQVEAPFSGVSARQGWGCSTLHSSLGVCCLLGGLPHQCVAGLTCWSLALSLLFFQQECVHL